MLVTIPDVLTSQEVAHIRRVLETTAWIDGRKTAGDQAAVVKNNRRVPSAPPEAKDSGQSMLRRSVATRASPRRRCL